MPRKVSMTVARWVLLVVYVGGTAIGLAAGSPPPLGASWTPTSQHPCASRYSVYDGACGRWVDNPLGLPAAWTDTGLVGQAVDLGLVLVLAACLGLAAPSAVLRFRRPVGDARLQMRWFALAAAVLLGWIVFSAVAENSEASGQDPLWSEICFASATALIPLACGMAILRYRLYDIDRIVCRTLSNATVTGLLVATFTVIVVSASRRQDLVRVVHTSLQPEGATLWLTSRA